MGKLYDHTVLKWMWENQRDDVRYIENSYHKDDWLNVRTPMWRPRTRYRLHMKNGHVYNSKEVVALPPESSEPPKPQFNLKWQRCKPGSTRYDLFVNQERITTLDEKFIAKFSSVELIEFSRILELTYMQAKREALDDA